MFFHELKILLPILLLSWKLCAQNDKNFASKGERKVFYKKLIEKYSSENTKEIWLADKEDFFDSYIDGHKESELLESFATVIHELLHGYNQSENKGHTYFIEKGIRIHVPFTDVYNSKELNSVVRKSLQDSIFRYGLYVGGKSTLPGLGHVSGVNDSKKNEVMSVQLGIYGLIEEFSAYYYGDLSAFELDDYYHENFAKDDTEAWENYLDQINGDVVAFYEFQLFISWYLDYAKEKHPKMYDELLNNKKLRVVFTLMYDKFGALVKQIELKNQELKKFEKANVLDELSFNGTDDDFIKFLQMAGLPNEMIFEEKTKLVNGKSITTKKIILDKEELNELRPEYDKMVKLIKSEIKEDILLFFSNVPKQIEFLKKQFSSKLEKELINFRIDACTTSNYLNYLK